jgi:hypothetical protein
MYVHKPYLYVYVYLDMYIDIDSYIFIYIFIAFHQIGPSYSNEPYTLKTTLMLEALTSYCLLLIRQENFVGALLLAEEAYNYVAVAYNPVHPQIQKAAGVLIECLIHKGDLY